MIMQLKVKAFRQSQSEAKGGSADRTRKRSDRPELLCCSGPQGYLDRPLIASSRTKIRYSNRFRGLIPIPLLSSLYFHRRPCCYICKKDLRDFLFISAYMSTLMASKTRGTCRPRPARPKRQPLKRIENQFVRIAKSGESIERTHSSE